MTAATDRAGRTIVAPDEADDTDAAAPSLVRRWLPFAAALAAVTGILLLADTSVLDLARFAGYAVLAVALPGTLVYRVLRRTPHTFVEDVAMGIAVGLALEIGAWAGYSALGLQGWLWSWPVLVVVPFLAVPALRRHWRVRGYAPTPVGWSWAVAGAVVFFTAYLAQVFLERNPILPTSEETRQYLDLAYQLSLAGEAKHSFPPGFPQAAGEPLRYHWFSYVHMASTSLVAGIDLTVVSLRLAVPALCAAAVVLTAVVGWRVSGRPYAGAAAAVLFWVIGETSFTDPVGTPFGTQATFVIWHGISMIYSWVLLIALLAPIADALGRVAGSRVPALGRRGYLLVALFALASSAAKASSLPVVLAALAFVGAIVLVTQGRISWPVVALGAVVAAAQVFATAVIFQFQTYGLRIDPLAPVTGYWSEPPVRADWKQALIVLAVAAAFLVNMQLRLGGIVALLWHRRGKLEPVGWFLLGGALAGPALYLSFYSINSQYFTRAGFTFGVILSGWGYAVAVERARLSREAKLALGVGAGLLAGLLVGIQLALAGPQPTDRPYSALIPILAWFTVFALALTVGAALWMLAAIRRPALRGRGGVVLLTAVLVFGAPGLVMDMAQSARNPNGGAYFNIDLPRSRVLAARWVRDHSRPSDVLATNAHCLWGTAAPDCDSRSFWLSAYAERSVLVEGWGFAPRNSGQSSGSFWDPGLLELNDSAFTAPSATTLTELRRRHRVRWLVVDRAIGFESSSLGTLARLRYDNGRVAVYEVASVNP